MSEIKKAESIEHGAESKEAEVKQGAVPISSDESGSPSEDRLRGGAEGKKDGKGSSAALDKILSGAAERIKAKESGGGEPAPEEKPDGKKEDKAPETKEGVKKPDEKAPAKKDEIVVTEADRAETPEGLNDKAKTAFWRLRAKDRLERERLQKENEDLKKGARGEGRVPISSDESGSSSEDRLREGKGDKGGKAAVERSLDTDTQVFKFLATAEKVLAGETVPGWDEAKAVEVKKLAEGLIVDMDNPQWCLDIIDKAKKGEFGDLSAQIAERAQKEYALIDGRGKRAEGLKQQEAEKVKALTESIQKAINVAYERHPALKDDKSPEAEFGREWMKKNVIGTAEKPGARIREIYDPELVGGVIDDMMAAWKAHQFDELQKKQAAANRGGPRPLSGGGSQLPAGSGGEAKKGSSQALTNIFDKYKK